MLKKEADYIWARPVLIARKLGAPDRGAHELPNNPVGGNMPQIALRDC